MRKLFLLILIFLTNEIFSQSIFDFIKANDVNSIKNYSDSINIRDDKKATPLMWAVYKSDLKMVKLLVSKGANPRLKGWITYYDTTSPHIEFMYGSCITIAAGENKMDILKYLLRKHNISVEDKEYNLFENIENGWNALQWASAKGNVEIIRYLIKKGANINSKAETDNNQTSLHLSLFLNKREAARILVDFGADINKPDLWGSTPLEYAINLEDRDLIRFLYKKGARFSEKNKEILEKRLFDMYLIKTMDEI